MPFNVSTVTKIMLHWFSKTCSGNVVKRNRNGQTRMRKRGYTRARTHTHTHAHPQEPPQTPKANEDEKGGDSLELSEEVCQIFFGKKLKYFFYEKIFQIFKRDSRKHESAVEQPLKDVYQDFFFKKKT